MLIESGITRKYAETWTVAAAIRELIQNWIDLQRTFGHGRLTYHESTLTIADKGPGLQLRHLALGVSEKVDPHAIGQFGEGLKLALLVLSRESRRVTILSNGQKIEPIFGLSPAYGIETLSYNVSSMDTTPGTTIRIECTFAEYEEARLYFLDLHAERKLASRTQPIYSQPHGIYIMGSYITGRDRDNGYALGYDLREEPARQLLNRDRTSADRQQTQNMVRHMLAKETAPGVIDAVIQSDRGFAEHHIDWTYGTFTILARRAWLAGYHRKYGRKVCYSIEPKADHLAEYMGFTVVGTDYYECALCKMVGMLSSIAATRKPRSKTERPRKIPQNQLTKEEKGRLAYAIRLTKRFYIDPGKVIIVETLDNGDTDGEYDRKEHTIRLARQVLAHSRRTLHVLLHETAHKESGEDDCTHEYEEALLSITVGILENAHPSRF